MSQLKITYHPVAKKAGWMCFKMKTESVYDKLLFLTDGQGNLYFIREKTNELILFDTDFHLQGYEHNKIDNPPWESFVLDYFNKLYHDIVGSEIYVNNI